MSIDTEMAWGVVHHGSIGRYSYSNDEQFTERDVIAALLELFDRYEIHATWAIVGHLFLEDCESVDGRKHPEIVRPDYPWFEGDWFDADPATDAATDPMWYGPDIVEAIRTCPTYQEIGSHTFSHIIVGDPGCTAENLRSDLAACRKLADGRGIALRSFIHPRNKIGHVDILADEGFTAFRGKRPISFSGYPRAVKRMLGALDTIWPMSGSAVYPRRVAGLWDLPATNLYSPGNRRRIPLPIGWYNRQQIRRLRQAVRHRGLFHLWFHSHNFTAAPETALRGFEEILQEAARLRAAGMLENPTMAQLAERLNVTT